MLAFDRVFAQSFEVCIDQARSHIDHEYVSWPFVRFRCAHCVVQRLIKVDGKVRTDTTFPAGFMGEATLVLFFPLHCIGR